MDREQRETELRTLLTSQRGKEEMLAILKEQAGMTEGNLPPFGTLLVETILNYEFPPATDAEAATAPVSGSPSDKVEPGDAKFSQPPGQEAPGG